METTELISLIKEHMEFFNEDIEVSKTQGLDYDRAYAEGAYNAYELILNKLVSENTNG